MIASVTGSATSLSSSVISSSESASEISFSETISSRSMIKTLTLSTNVGAAEGVVFCCATGVSGSAVRVSGKGGSCFAAAPWILVPSLFLAACSFSFSPPNMRKKAPLILVWLLLTAGTRSQVACLSHSSANADDRVFRQPSFARLPSP